MISYGYIGSLKKKFKLFVSRIKDPYPFDKILVEPELYSSKLPSFFSKASYDDKMYKNTVAAIVRPGLGTVTKCLTI